MRPAQFVVAAMSLASAAPAASAQTLPTYLTVSAEARVEHAPDLAEITAGVTTTAPGAVAASRENAEKMAQVIAALHGARVSAGDIQTAGIGLQPQYDYKDRQAPHLTGYQATNSVTVRMRDLPRAGAVIDALVAAGANQIGGPTFLIADEEPVRDLARAAAVAKARARAELYARALGLHVRRIARVSEGGAPQPIRPVPMMRMTAMAASAPTPVEPGQLGIDAEVTIEFELD
jgi:uncharacterized protein YggE